MSIGDNIQKYRKLNKLTQAELGEKIGKKERTIRGYEANDTIPPTSVLIKIGEVLNVPMIKLINNTGKDFAQKENIKDKKISLLYDFLKNEFNEDININPTLEDTFIELYIGENKTIYSKKDFEMFSHYVLASFQNFNSFKK